jgi:hypothetical protein
LDEELAKGYHAYTLSELFPENEEYLNWAKTELDQLADQRAAYQPVQVDPQIYDSFVGDYDIPPELGLPYPFYRIDVLNESLFLKIKTDKGWLELLPLSETSFYHVSSFAQFEVTFLPDENGVVDQFIYKEYGKEYVFNRLTGDVDEDSQQPAPSPSPSTILTPTPLSVDTSPEGDQTSSSSLEESLFLETYWWILPGAVVIVLIGWYLFRRSKGQ